MYQQGAVDNIHLLHANKMAETLMRLQQQGQDYPDQQAVGNDRRAAEEAVRNQYDHSSSAALNFAASQHQQAAPTGNGATSNVQDSENGSSLFVVIPRTEYDFMKQEIITLKHSLNELKSSVNYEIHQLKTESKSLKQRVDCCTCNTNMRVNKDTSGGRKPATWSSENAWDGRTFATNQQSGVNVCSPPASSPDQIDRSSAVATFTALGSYSGSSCVGGSLPSLTCGIFGSPEHGNSSGNAPDSDRGKMVQLLPNYDVWVSKLNLQITVNEAPTRKEGAALYLLRRIIPLVFTWDELACSRGQGLNCKTTDDVFGRAPLDPTKVMACKAFMRKFCADIGCMEPTERSVNQTFSHQVNYARRRIKTAGQPCAQRKPKKTRRNQSQLSQQADPGIDSTSSSRKGPIQPKNERYMQI